MFNYFHSLSKYFHKRKKYYQYISNLHNELALAVLKVHLIDNERFYWSQNDHFR